MSGEDLVVIGEVVRPHGVHGAVRVTLQTDRPERFEALRECVLWDPASDVRSASTAAKSGSGFSTIPPPPPN